MADASDPRNDLAGSPDASDAVPKLPRGRGLRLSRPQLIRIAGTLLLLVFLLFMQHPCADAVSRFVTGFGDQGSAAAQMPRPGTVDLPQAGSGSGSNAADPYEHLKPGMTDDEVKAVIDRARVRAAGSSAP